MEASFPELAGQAKYPCHSAPSPEPCATTLRGLVSWVWFPRGSWTNKGEKPPPLRNMKSQLTWALRQVPGLNGGRFRRPREWGEGSARSEGLKKD